MRRQTTNYPKKKPAVNRPIGALSAALSLLFLQAPAKAQSQPPSVFSVSAGPAHGTAFLATGVPGVPGPAVITALHVVGGRKRAELRIRDCVDGKPMVSELDDASLTFDQKTPVIVWEALDLVAFPVAENPTWKAVPLAPGPLAIAHGAPVAVLGMTRTDACPDGVGTFKYTTIVANLVAQLHERTDFGQKDLGTLDRAAYLLFLFSSAGPGVSGCAVLDDQRRLLGLYQGGDNESATSNWAVRISVSDLMAFPHKTMTLNTLSSSSKPRLTEAQLDDFVRDKTHERPTGAFLALQSGYFHEFGDPDSSGVRIEAMGYAPAWPALNTSLGLFLAVGGAVGQSSRIVHGPLGTTGDERSRVDFKQLTGTLGIGARFWQQRSLRISVAAGWRLGARLVEDTPEPGQRTGVVHGPELLTSPCLSLSLQLSLCLQMAFGWVWHRPEEYRVELGTPQAIAMPSRFSPEAFFGGALAFGSWLRVKPVELPQ